VVEVAQLLGALSPEQCPCACCVWGICSLKQLSYHFTAFLQDLCEGDIGVFGLDLCFYGGDWLWKWELHWCLLLASTPLVFIGETVVIVVVATVATVSIVAIVVIVSVVVVISAVSLACVCVLSVARQ